MARGNQRDVAREKSQKKAKEQAKKKGANERDGNKGLTVTERKQRDAQIMQEKLKKASEAKKSETA